MWRAIGNILNLVLPPTREATLLADIAPADLQRLYTPVETADALALCRYEEPVIRAAIIAAKFQSHQNAVGLLATLLDIWQSEKPQTHAIWIPMPLGRARARSRGYNQVERILQASQQLDPALIRTDVLYRSRETMPQTELPKSARSKNVVGAFSVAPGANITGAHLILVDDVLTSGNTMRSARQALLAAGPASLTCLALAH